MKGISLLSDLFMLFALISVTIMMTLFLWYLILIYEFALQPAGMSTTRDVTLRLLIEPADYDSTMLAFLELKHQGITMKRLLNAAAIQGSTDIWIDGKDIDLAAVAESALTPMIENDYILKIASQPEINVVTHGAWVSGNTPMGLQEVSTDLFLLNGGAVELQLLVRD